MYRLMEILDTAEANGSLNKSERNLIQYGVDPDEQGSRPSVPQQSVNYDKQYGVPGYYIDNDGRYIRDID